MIKFVFAFLISLMTLPVLADTYVLFTADAVEYAINNLVESEYRLDAVNEYIKQMDEETGGISVLGIFKVCSAAGKSILTNDGYNDCKRFIEKMAEISGFDDVDEANKNNCVNKFGGVWAIVEQEGSSEYQCVGKDGYKLVYKKVCKDGVGECIKDFAGLKTQGPIGREFILEYGKRKGLNFTCHMGYETRRGITSPLGQDYIRCSVGGKAYEFEFDSLNAEPDKSFDYEVDALCNFFGGKLEKNGGAQKRLYCAIPANVKNYDFEKFASKIGHNATCELGKCRLLQYDEAVYTKNIGNLKTISGVNSYKFYNAGIQTNADMAKVQLEEYLHNIFPNEGRITCNSSIKKYNVGLNVYDYVMSCFVDSQPVDFVFDDLTESSETRVNAGIEAMQCITNGGTYKGEYCRGATREECDALDAVLRAKGSEEGAFWDDDARACVMGNSKKTYIVDTVKGYIVGAVFIVGAAVVVVASDGLAIPVVVGTLESLTVEGLFTWAQYANHERLDNKAANRFLEFKNDADKCNDEACALNVIKNHWQTLNGVLDDLNKDDMAMVDETMDKLIGMIDLTEMVPCDSKGSDKMGFCTKLMVAEDSSEKRLSDYTDPVSEIALIIGDVIYNPGYVTQKFVKIHNGLQASKAIKASQVVDTTKDLSKTGKVMDTGTDAAKAGKEVSLAEGSLNASKSAEIASDLSKNEKSRIFVVLENSDDIVPKPNYDELADTYNNALNYYQNGKEIDLRQYNSVMDNVNAKFAKDNDFVMVNITDGTATKPVVEGSRVYGTTLDITDTNFSRELEELASFKYSEKPDSAILKKWAEPITLDTSDPHYLQEMGELEKLEISSEVPDPIMVRKLQDTTNVADTSKLQETLRALDAAGVDKAGIPISIKVIDSEGNPIGHVMTITKDGKKYTFYDQYPLVTVNKQANEFKTKVLGDLVASTPNDSDIIVNMGKVCENETGTCAIFSRNVIERFLTDAEYDPFEEVYNLNITKKQLDQIKVDKAVTDVYEGTVVPFVYEEVQPFLKEQ